MGVFFMSRSHLIEAGCSDTFDPKLYIRVAKQGGPKAPPFDLLLAWIPAIIYVT